MFPTRDYFAYPRRFALPDNDAVRLDHLDRVSSGVPDVSLGHQRHQPGRGLALHVRVHRRREITLDLSLDSAPDLALDLALDLTLALTKIWI